WFGEVKDALDSPKAKESEEYKEAIKYVVFDVGSAANPRLRYDPDTYELTWLCRKKAFAAPATDEVIKDRVIAFLKYAGSNRFNRKLFEADDIQPGRGKLKFHIVLDEPPPPPRQPRQPSPTLKKTRPGDWFGGVKGALNSPRGKASNSYKEASKYVDLDVGPDKNPSFRYDPNTYELTWFCKKRRSALPVSDKVIKDAVIEFLKEAGGGNFDQKLYEGDDVKPDTGALKFNIVL